MSLALAPFEVIEERRTTPRWNNVLANTVEVANKGRAAGATVMHAPISFAEGYGELTTHPYGILKGVVDNKAFRRGSWGAAIVDALTTQPQDILIEGERGLDAVSSTNLDFILRSSHDEFLNLLAGRARLGPRTGYQSASCLCPHCLQANFTRVAPFSAEIRFGAPHFPHTVSMRVLPCFTTRALRSMVSRIRRSASSRIDCFDIRSHLC